ncbi:uncharacterized protein DDB_G0283697-like isoform X1 [Physella acuta]|uniref:uncharacterized protein DDB_G0283697-like isoform X1 n=1 Tax=Physella acuta TaxID=109671 RepID=UPI0027DB2018|nr:uncharacterized protein DDB_G0283697-like isoform X1 [Physella acuta]
MVSKVVVLGVFACLLAQAVARIVDDDSDNASYDDDDDDDEDDDFDDVSKKGNHKESKKYSKKESTKDKKQESKKGRKEETEEDSNEETEEDSNQETEEDSNQETEEDSNEETEEDSNEETEEDSNKGSDYDSDYDPSEESREDEDCEVNGKKHKNGDIFTTKESKCIKYKCEDGDVSIEEEGCEHQDKCYKVNSKFEKDCVSYSCVKSEKGDATYFSVKVQSIRCKDSTGKCWKGGEKFKNEIKGVKYKNCVCNVIGKMASISCKKS